MEWCGTLIDGGAGRFATDADFDFFRLTSTPHGPPNGDGPGRAFPDGPRPNGSPDFDAPVIKLAVRKGSGPQSTTLWIKRPGERAYTRIGVAVERCIPLPQSHLQDRGPFPDGRRPESDGRSYDDDPNFAPWSPPREPGPGDRGPREPNPGQPDFRGPPPNRGNETPPRLPPSGSAPPEEGRDQRPGDPMPPMDRRRGPEEGDSRFTPVRPRIREPQGEGREPEPRERRERAPIEPPDLPKEEKNSGEANIPVSTERTAARLVAAPLELAVDGVDDLDFAAKAEYPGEVAADDGTAEAEMPSVLLETSAPSPLALDSTRTWSVSTRPGRIRVRSGLGSLTAHRGADLPEGNADVAVSTVAVSR